MSGDQGAMSPAAAAAAAAPPLDDDNLLSEILLRLPPQHSSLPRASLVSKRWLSLVSDPRFLRRFRIHHRPNLPFLGFFDGGLVFVPTLDPPNRVPYGRFSLQLDRGLRFRLLGCRHGLVLILIFLAPMRPSREKSRYQLLVWDPVTDDQRRIALPPRFDGERSCPMNGVVLRGAGEVHFQVVLVVADNRDTQITRMIACVYSSETGAWGDLISTLLPSKVFTSSLLTMVVPREPAVLIGDSLYWLIIGSSSGILEFDLDKQRLAVIPLPLPVNKFDNSEYSVMQADGDGLGFLFLSGFSAQLWKMKTDCDGVASWVLARTIELGELLSLDPEKDHAVLLGFAEYNNVVLLWTSMGTFMIQLESLQFKELPETHRLSCDNAFESVYTAGMAIGGGHDGAELLHNTYDDWSDKYAIMI